MSDTNNVNARIDLAWCIVIIIFTSDASLLGRRREQFSFFCIFLFLSSSSFVELLHVAVFPRIPSHVLTSSRILNDYYLCLWTFGMVEIPNKAQIENCRSMVELQMNVEQNFEMREFATLPRAAFLCHWLCANVRISNVIFVYVQQCFISFGVFISPQNVPTVEICCVLFG